MLPRRTPSASQEWRLCSYWWPWPLAGSPPAAPCASTPPTPCATNDVVPHQQMTFGHAAGARLRWNIQEEMGPANLHFHHRPVATPTQWVLASPSEHPFHINWSLYMRLPLTIAAC